MASSPRILNRPTDRHRPGTEAMQKARLPVHRRSACSGVKALRNTSHARRQSRQAVLPFRSLDPFRALREPDPRRRDEKRPFPLRTKNCQHYPKQPLDRKSPIQVRIHLPPAASLQTFGSATLPRCERPKKEPSKMSGNWKFESIPLQRRVRCEPVRKGSALGWEYDYAGLRDEQRSNREAFARGETRKLMGIGVSFF